MEQAADGLGAQVFETLLGVVEAVEAATANGIAGEVSEQALGVLVGHEPEAGSVFQIDDQVAGVVGHLDQKSQRMATPGGARNPLDQTGRPRHALKSLGILLEEAKFPAAFSR